MKRKAQEKNKELRFQHVTLAVSRPGEEIVSCALDDPRACVFYANKDGVKYAAARRIANVFSVEIRSARRMTGACHEHLHTETWSQPIGEAPQIPANTLFIAKAFELAETQR